MVLVGTSLDSKLPDPEEDPGQVQELGLDPAVATRPDVFEAVCGAWKERIRAQYSSWLNAKAEEFLTDLREADRAERVQRILDAVVVVPTSAKDWNRHHRGKKMHMCRIPEQTGVPELRGLINELATHQVATTTGRLKQRLGGLRHTVFESIERSESALGANIEGILQAIERSRSAMQEAQDRHVQVIEDLRLSVLERFCQVRETLQDKIQNAALKMRDIGRQQVHGHLSDLHWASLRATVNHDGFWKTRHGRQVNLRDAMGGEITRLVPQAWARIADERLAKHTEAARQQILDGLKAFTAAIRSIVDGQVQDDLSRRTVQRLFDAGLAGAENKIERSVSKVTELLGKTSKEMQQRVDEAVDLSLKGVCTDCSEDRGTGWKGRSVDRIVEGTSEVAEQAEKRCLEISEEALDRLEKAVVGFCQTGVAEMENMGSAVPAVLKDAVERAHLKTPQDQKALLEHARQQAPWPDAVSA